MAAFLAGLAFLAVVFLVLLAFLVLVLLFDFLLPFFLLDPAKISPQYFILPRMTQLHILNLVRNSKLKNM